MLNYINLSETVQFAKASIICDYCVLKEIKQPLFDSIDHFLSAMESPERRLKLGFRKIYSFPLNRGVPSIKVIDTKIMPVGIFPRPDLVSLECGCPLNWPFRSCVGNWGDFQI